MNRAQRRLAAPHIRTKRIIEPSNLSSMGSGLNAHRLVAKTAVQMALEYWEVFAAANNELYKSFRENLTEKQMLTAWCARIAPLFLEQARLSLTDCLNLSDAEMPPAQKAEIAEALILDNDMRASRMKAPEHMNVRVH